MKDATSLYLETSVYFFYKYEEAGCIKQINYFLLFFAHAPVSLLRPRKWGYLDSEGSGKFGFRKIRIRILKNTDLDP